MPDRIFLIFICTTALAGELHSQTPTEKVDLFALELATFDVEAASKLLTILDRNEDGSVDATEQQRLAWKDDAETFDLNHDGKLTQLELAVHEAKRRHDDDITMLDINNVNIFLRRYDSNRNGQLDPDEIAGGWPSNPGEYDGNGDGTITAREMHYRFAYNRGLRRAMGIERVDQTSAMRLIRQFDKNGDKKLSAAEREGLWLPRPADDFDENNDEGLGIMELATMLAKNRMDLGITLPDQIKINKLFAQHDHNGDGRISPEEQESPTGFRPQAQLHQYDTNADGVITISEVESLVADQRKEKGYTEEDFQKAVVMMQRHDENRSQYVEEYELFDQPQQGQLSKRLLSRADRNADERLDIDELSRHFAAERKATKAP